jgi:ferredoxin
VLQPGCTQEAVASHTVSLKLPMQAALGSIDPDVPQHSCTDACCPTCHVQVRPGMQRLQQLVLQLLATAWHFQATAHLQLAAAGAGSAGGAFAQLSSEGSWAELQAAAGPMQQSITELGELLLQQVDGNEQVADLRARAGLGRAC